MTYLSMTTYQVALMAMLPKTGATVELLAAATNLPLHLVREQMQGLAAVGQVVFRADTGTYTNPGGTDA